MTVPRLGEVTEDNPNYKQTVSGAIFEFVKKIVYELDPKDNCFVPKIVTDELIDLPVLEIKKYMVNFDLFL